MASKERKACQEAGEASTSRTPRLFAPPPKLRNGKSISSLPSRTSRDPDPQILRSLLIRCSKLPQGKSRSFPLSSRPHQSLIGSSPSLSLPYFLAPSPKRHDLPTMGGMKMAACGNRMRKTRAARLQRASVGERTVPPARVGSGRAAPGRRNPAGDPPQRHRRPGI